MGMTESGKGRDQRLTGMLREWLDSGEMSPDLGQRLLQALEDVVVAELKRRGLWNASPRYLGLLGEQWRDRDGSGPLRELLNEVFVAAIAEPLPRWRNLLADPAASLEAALVQAIRNHLHELQRRHDRLGYDLYQRSKEAVLAAIAAGELFFADPHDSQRISNHSVLTADPAGGMEPVPAEKLAERTPFWVDTLLPELVVGIRESRRQAVERLRQHLAGLAAEGIVCWRFKDMLDPLKATIRARWQSRAESGDNDDGPTVTTFDEDGHRELVRTLNPRDPDQLEREHLEKLLECLAVQIGRHSAQQRTLDHIWGLFLYLQTFIAPGSDEDELPSARELEKQLKIPREKVPSLLEVLGRFLRLCRKLLLSRLVPGPLWASGGQP